MGGWAVAASPLKAAIGDAMKEREVDYYKTSALAKARKALSI
jgi:hypothetical protein